MDINIIMIMCRMMAPMGNGDLGHHPEKMLPPPEAPDIQVDIVITPDITYKGCFCNWWILYLPQIFQCTV